MRRRDAQAERDRAAGGSPPICDEAAEPGPSAPSLLWASASISYVGDGIRTAALPLLAVSVTRDPVAISGLAVALWLPWLLFGLHGGALVDRADRGRLLRNVQLLRFACVGGLAVLVLTDHLSMIAVYVAGFGVGAGEVLAGTALQSMVPALVPDDQLEKMNGRLAAAETASTQFAGPSLGGLLFSVARSVPFVVDALSFLASAGFAERLRRSIPSGRAASSAGSSLTRDAVEGLNYLRRHPALRTLAVWAAFMNLSVNAADAVLVLFCVEKLDLGGAGFGLLLAAAGVGGFVGAAAVGFFVTRVGREGVLLGSSLVAGTATFLIGTSRSAYLVGVLQFFVGFSAVSFAVVGRSLRQALSPPELIGRITGSFRTLSYGVIPGGALAGGLMASRLGLRAPFVVAGLAVAGVSAVAGISLIRSRNAAH